MTPWVVRLLVANGAMFLLAPPGGPLFADLALVPAWILSRPWTPVTYMFLHGSLGHLFFNMLALFFFGPRVEARLGSRSFLQLYLFSGIGGAALSAVFAPFAPVVGASGAVYGVLLAFARFWPREPIYIWMVLPVQARWLIAAMVVLSLYSGMSGAQDGIAHFAHLGGFVGGWAYLKWLDRKKTRFKRKVESPNSSFGSVGPRLQGKPDRWRSIRLEDLHELNRAEVEMLLARVQRDGPSALSSEERAFLDRMATAQGLR